MEIPTKNGKLEIVESSGRCIVATELTDVEQAPGEAAEATIKRCPIKGGGLVKVREIVNAGDAIPAWDGRAIVLCGDHFLALCGVAFKAVG